MKIPTVSPWSTEVRMEIDVPIAQFRENPDGKGSQLGLDRHLIVAALEVNRARVTFRMLNEAGEMIGDRWDTHPERVTIKKWLEQRGAADDFCVLYFIAAHVITEWLVLPKRTATSHKKLYSNIHDTSRALKGLLQETGERYFRGGGHGLEGARVCDLFTDKEAKDITDTVDGWNESHPEVMDDGTERSQSAKTMFPTVEELLDRIASAAGRIEAQGPIHSQPNKRGALNGFFIRRMGTFLQQRYGETPIEVLSASASIALNEVIDDDLTRKSVHLSERSRGK